MLSREPDRVPEGLLDTSVVIDLEQLRPEQLPAQISVSAVTMAELSAAPGGLCRTVGPCADHRGVTGADRRCSSVLPFPPRRTRSFGRDEQASGAAAGSWCILPSMSIALATVLRNIPVPQQYLVALTCGEVVQRLRPARVPGSRGVRVAAGGALVTTAIALIGWSLYATRIVDLEHPDRLIISGPYALSRNPMYAAWASLAVGAGLLRNSMWMLASAPIGAGFVHRDVLKEELDLAVRHPEQFPHYAAAVPRYLPARRVAGRRR